jgi:hypothetical protein
MTLIEIVVAMSIMTVVMVIFTGAIVQMFRITRHTESMAVSQSQLHIAFQRIDREVQYAAGISVPLQLTNADVAVMPKYQGLTAGDWYVEYLTTTFDGPSVCAELRLVASKTQLQRRVWPPGHTPSGGWSVLASQVTSPEPFLFIPAGSDGSDYQRLTITLHSADPSLAASRAASRDISVGFAAENTSVSTSSDTICAEGRVSP